MLIESTLIALVVIAISYRLHRFDFASVKGVWLLIASVLLVAIASRLMASPWRARIVAFTLAIQLVRFVLLAGFVASNAVALKSIWLFGCGALLNALVIIANGGYMPVDVSLARQFGYTRTIEALMQGDVFGHQVLTPLSLWVPLADIIHIAPPYPWPKTISVGDIVIDLSLLAIVIELIVVARKGENHVV